MAGLRRRIRAGGRVRGVARPARSAAARARAEAVAARKPGFWPICVAYGLFGFGYVVTATFLVTIVREAGGQSEALVWLVVGVAAAPSILVWNRIAARVRGVGAAFALRLLAEAAGVAASVLWQGLAGALRRPAALLGATFMGITALGLAVARRTGGGERRIVAVMTASFGLGRNRRPRRRRRAARGNGLVSVRLARRRRRAAGRGGAQPDLGSGLTRRMSRAMQRPTGDEAWTRRARSIWR